MAIVTAIAFGCEVCEPTGASFGYQFGKYYLQTIADFF